MLVLCFFLLAVLVLVFVKSIGDEDYPIEKPIGLYSVQIQIDNVDYNINVEVSLEREYGEGDIVVRHLNVYGVPNDKMDSAKNILLHDHTLISKDDVKWVK